MPKIYAVDIPESETFSPEATLIKENISRLERYMYENTYSKEVQKLNKTEPSVANRSGVRELKEKIRNTNCRLCKDKVKGAITDFNNRLLKHQIRKTQLHITDYLHGVNDKLYTHARRITHLRDSLEARPDTLKKSFELQMMEQDLQAAEQAMTSARHLSENLDSLSQHLQAMKDLDQVEDMKAQLQLAIKKLQNRLEAACEKTPGWCIYGRREE